MRPTRARPSIEPAAPFWTGAVEQPPAAGRGVGAVSLLDPSDDGWSAFRATAAASPKVRQSRMSTGVPTHASPVVRKKLPLFSQQTEPLQS